MSILCIAAAVRLGIPENTSENRCNKLSISFLSRSPSSPQISTSSHVSLLLSWGRLFSCGNVISQVSSTRQAISSGLLCHLLSRFTLNVRRCLILLPVSTSILLPSFFTCVTVNGPFHLLTSLFPGVGNRTSTLSPTSKVLLELFTS